MMATTWKGFYDSDILLSTYGMEGHSLKHALYICVWICVGFISCFLLALFPPRSSLLHFRWRLKEARTDSTTDEKFDSIDKISRGSSVNDEVYGEANLDAPLLLRKTNLDPTLGNGNGHKELDEDEMPSTELSFDNNNSSSLNDSGGLGFGFDDRDELLEDSKEGFVIAFKKIHFSHSRSPNNDITDSPQVLKQVGGKVMPGELTAIMGLTGSGKSTLLNVLAGRSRPTSGTILYDEQIPTKRVIRRCSYIMSEDIHYETLTVFETIMFAARLRREGSESGGGDELSVKVDEALDMVSMKKHALKLVSELTKGEKKRLSIAEEGVMIPRAIFVDEPTTGLTPPDMLDVVNCLLSMCFEQRTVVVTLHQPIQPVFEAIDKLLLLSEGRIIYGGPTSEVISYFTSQNLEYELTVGKNPAEFLVDIAGGLIASSTGEIISSSFEAR